MTPPSEPKSLLSLAEETAIRPYGVSAVGADEILVIGVSNFQAAGGDRNALALRTDLSGKVKWAKQIAGTYNDQFLAHAVVGTTLHGFGITRSAFTGGMRNNDVLWVQFNAADGAVTRSRHFGTNTDEDVMGATALTDGVVLVGTTSANADAFIAKLGSSGNVVWAKRWTTPGNDAFRSVHRVADGFVAVGFSTIAGGGKNAPIVAKFNDAGAHQWSRRIAGLPDEGLAYSALPVSDGIVLVGHMRAAASAPTSAFALKLSADGAAVSWAKSYATAGAASLRSTVLVAADAMYGLPETVAVGGYVGSDAAMATLATSDGSVVRSLAMKSPAGATLVAERQVLFARADKGLGLLFHATPMDTSISTIGMALPNRLLELPASCAWTSTASFTASSLTVTSAALMPTSADLSFSIADNGSSLAADDAVFTTSATCK